MKNLALTLSLLIASFGVVQAQMPERVVAPAGAELYFISPTDGATVKGPVVVRFGLKGMGVAPAGIKLPDTGHHHLFVDTALPTDMNKPIGVVENKIIHYGLGQTETTLTLPPGKHTLQLLLADFLHVPHASPLVSKLITITVVP
jgi:hypothetical protein